MNEHDGFYVLPCTDFDTIDFKRIKKKLQKKKNNQVLVYLTVRLKEVNKKRKKRMIARANEQKDHEFRIGSIVIFLS